MPVCRLAPLPPPTHDEHAVGAAAVVVAVVEGSTLGRLKGVLSVPHEHDTQLHEVLQDVRGLHHLLRVALRLRGRMHQWGAETETESRGSGYGQGEQGERIRTGRAGGADTDRESRQGATPWCAAVPVAPRRSACGARTCAAATCAAPPEMLPTLRPRPCRRRRSGAHHRSSAAAPPCTEEG